MTKDRRALARLPLLVLGMLSLVGGVLAGLARLGIEMPPVAAAQSGAHGALMIAAFFGTVISLERAVALGRLWAYLAPAAAGLGGVLLLAGVPAPLSESLFVVAAATLVAGSAVVIRRQTALYTVVLALGAGCWLVGTIVWAAFGGVPPAVPWWLAFLVLTIAGERLELTRFLPTKPLAPPLFIIAVAIVLGGAMLALADDAVGLSIVGVGFVAVAAWLLRYDIARHNARQKGLTRFIALCLLSGYVWLALGGALGAMGSFAAGEPARDAALHAVALGFVFAMVFGHAPIIFPTIAKVRIPYHPIFYLPLAALHISLAFRVAGSPVEFFGLRQLGGALNALALLLFIVTMLATALRARRRD